MDDQWSGFGGVWVSGVRGVVSGDGVRAVGLSGGRGSGQWSGANGVGSVGVGSMGKEVKETTGIQAHCTNF